MILKGILFAVHPSPSSQLLCIFLVYGSLFSISLNPVCHAPFTTSTVSGRWKPQVDTHCLLKRTRRVAQVFNPHAPLQIIQVGPKACAGLSIDVILIQYLQLAMYKSEWSGISVQVQTCPSAMAVTVHCAELRDSMFVPPERKRKHFTCTSSGLFSLDKKNPAVMKNA